MPNNVFSKLEEQITKLLSQLEAMHQDIKLLKEENLVLKNERSHSLQKLQEITALFDSFEFDNHSKQTRKYAYSEESRVAAEEF